MLTHIYSWHEHDPWELVHSVETCIEEATKKFIELGHKASDIKAIGLTNQRETTLVWDAETGEPLHNAIAWPDTRTKGLVREFKERKGDQNLSEICGIPLSTYPSCLKLVWMLRHIPEVQQAYDEGRLCFGTVDTWLIYNLNGGKEKNVFVTDSTNASRTMFMNLHTCQYDDNLLSFFDLDRNKLRLPKIVPSSCADAYGTLAKGTLKGMKIAGCLGDQSSALVGQQGFTPGSAKNTYGTGCFLLYNVGEKPTISTHGLLATVAYDFGRNRKPVYALEGSVAVAGSGVKFLMNNMGFIAHAEKVSELASTVDDNGGLVFVTAFSGLFAPYWIDDAKGTIFGITQHTQRGHIARATLEATCFQTKAILDAMEKDSGHALSDLAVDGGMSNSNICMQVSHTQEIGTIKTRLTLNKDTIEHHRYPRQPSCHARNYRLGCRHRRRFCCRHLERVQRAQGHQPKEPHGLRTRGHTRRESKDVQEVGSCSQHVPWLARC